MVVWSQICQRFPRNQSIFNLLRSSLQPGAIKNVPQIRYMSGDHGPRTINITASRFQWHKFKDLFHFYVLIGIIPVSILLFYVNVFIGPATLTPLPDDYTPQHWEYIRHPVSRFLARYIHMPPQQQYETALHVIYEESERQKLRELTAKVKRLIKERKDYKAYYYVPVTAKYLRVSKDAADFLESSWGDE